MKSLQAIGGWSALLIAATYIFGFGLFLGVLDRTGYDGPAGDLAFVVDNQSLLAVAMIALYVLAGCALVTLTLAMHERLAPGNSRMNPIAAGFGMIWAGLVIASGFVGLIGIQAVTELAVDQPDHATSAWTAIAVVQDALGGGIELVGGVWMVLISLAALNAGIFSKPLNYLGIGIGTAGILTVVPGLGDLAALFGLAQIVWFGWLAIILLSASRR